MCDVCRVLFSFLVFVWFMGSGDNCYSLCFMLVRCCTVFFDVLVNFVVMFCGLYECT